MAGEERSSSAHTAYSSHLIASVLSSAAHPSDPSPFARPLLLPCALHQSPTRRSLPLRIHPLSLHGAIARICTPPPPLHTAMTSLRQRTAISVPDERLSRLQPSPTVTAAAAKLMQYPQAAQPTRSGGGVPLWFSIYYSLLCGGIIVGVGIWFSFWPSYYHSNVSAFASGKRVLQAAAFCSR